MRITHRWSFEVWAHVASHGVCDCGDCGGECPAIIRISNSITQSMWMRVTWVSLCVCVCSPMIKRTQRTVYRLVAHSLKPYDHLIAHDQSLWSLRCAYTRIHLSWGDVLFFCMCVECINFNRKAHAKRRTANESRDHLWVNPRRHGSRDHRRMSRAAHHLYICESHHRAFPRHAWPSHSSNTTAAQYVRAIANASIYRTYGMHLSWASQNKLVEIALHCRKFECGWGTRVVDDLLINSLYVKLCAYMWFWLSL